MTDLFFLDQVSSGVKKGFLKFKSAISIWTNAGHNVDNDEDQDADNNDDSDADNDLDENPDRNPDLDGPANQMANDSKGTPFFIHHTVNIGAN